MLFQKIAFAVSRTKFSILKEFLRISSDWFLLVGSWKMGEVYMTTTSRWSRHCTWSSGCEGWLVPLHPQIGQMLGRCVFFGWFFTGLFPIKCIDVFTTTVWIRISLLLSHRPPFGRIFFDFFSKNWSWTNPRMHWCTSLCYQMRNAQQHSHRSWSCSWRQRKKMPRHFTRLASRRRVVCWTMHSGPFWANSWIFFGRQQVPQHPQHHVLIWGFCLMMMQSRRYWIPKKGQMAQRSWRACRACFVKFLGLRYRRLELPCGWQKDQAMLASTSIAMEIMQPELCRSHWMTQRITREAAFASMSMAAFISCRDLLALSPGILAQSCMG